MSFGGNTLHFAEKVRRDSDSDEETDFARGEVKETIFSRLEVSIEPKEVPLCYDEHLFRHLVNNESPFPVVCRLLSSAPPGYLILMESPRFVVEPNGCYPLSVKKAVGWGRGRTEILQLQVLPVDEHFQTMDLWELKAQQLFQLGRRPLAIKIRYERPPPYVAAATKLSEPIENATAAQYFDKVDNISCGEFDVIDAVMTAKQRKKNTPLVTKKKKSNENQ